MGARAKAQPAASTPGSERAACAAGALFSTVATWLQMVLLVGTLAPAALPDLLPAAGAGALVAAAAALLQWRTVPAQAARLGTPAPAAPAAAAGAYPPAPAAAAAPHTTSAGPLRLREALLVSAVLAAVSLLVGWAQRHHGNNGLLLGTALSALADAHAPVAALAGLQAAGQVDSHTLVQGVLLAALANGLTRAVTAFVAGGPSFGWRVAASLLLSTAAAAATGWVWGLR